VTEPWLTKAELAAALKISRRKVERLRLPSMRVGGQNRYLLSEVEGWLRGEGTPAVVVDLHPTRKGSAA
jgi:hypothetical protein